MTEFSSAALGMHPTFIRSYLRRTTTVPHDSREPMAGFATEGGLTQSKAATLAEKWLTKLGRFLFRHG
tara:strand:+ start:737 stop:940 length:204 start_codon:yes stop_codon:yes gene_type:complete